MSHATESRKGFTLVELAVVIVIIGVLAAFGVPQFLKSVERSKAAEAFNYLSAVRSAQERYLAKNGIYWAGSIDNTTGAMTSTTSGAETLDINQTPPKYFTGGTAGTAAAIAVGASSAVVDGAAQPTWNCTLSRLKSTSSYGNYTVVYDQEGYLPTATATNTRTSKVASLAKSTIDAEINPMGQ
jgi:prepilin-type N-terminal cleavage/methylation domain-containing protein